MCLLMYIFYKPCSLDHFPCTSEGSLAKLLKRKQEKELVKKFVMRTFTKDSQNKRKNRKKKGKKKKRKKKKDR